MPASLLEGHKSGPAEAGDRLRTGVTLFGKQLTVAVDAVCIVRLLSLVGVVDRLQLDVSSGESLAGERLVAVATVEAFSVPRLVSESDSAADDHLFAFSASGRVLVLVAFDAFVIGQQVVGG